MEKKEEAKDEQQKDIKKENEKLEDKLESPTKNEKKEEPKKEDEPKKEEEPKNDAPKEKTSSATEEIQKSEDKLADKLEVPKDIALENTIEENDLICKGTTWDNLGVKEEIKKGLIEMEFIRPSKIQSTTFPIIMKKDNLMAQAKNGSGKTGAFGLGIISSIDENSKEIQAVILAHVRELVVQIADVLSKIAKYTNVKVTALLDQQSDIGQVIVATPGHFENLYLKRKESTNKLKNLKIFVLDEADYMLTNDLTASICDKSFKIFKKNSINPQVLFFSATFDERCYKIIQNFFKKIKMIQIKKEDLTLDNVRQMYKYCEKEEDKVAFIEEYLKVNSNSERVIIFANKRDNVVKLQETLISRGYKVFILMGGDMAKENRDETIRRFRTGEIQILITTNVLARGYDERLVKLVINFDLPITKNNYSPEFITDCETYLHRIGRTGRFGTKGIGLSLCCGKQDMARLLEIENHFKTKIEEIKDLDIILEELKKLSLEKH